MEAELILRDFVSGREKNKITDWWHDRIGSEVRTHTHAHTHTHTRIPRHTKPRYVPTPQMLTPTEGEEMAERKGLCGGSCGREIH